MEFQLSVYKLSQNRVKPDTQQTFTSPMSMTLELKKKWRFNSTALRKNGNLILLHLERPKLYTILAFLSATGFMHV